MEASDLPLRPWAIALYLVVSRPKGVSSVQLAKDLGVTQKTAWFLAHRIREGSDISLEAFDGPVEIDEPTSAARRKTSTGASVASTLGIGRKRCRCSESCTGLPIAWQPCPWSLRPRKRPTASSPGS